MKFDLVSDRYIVIPGEYTTIQDAIIAAIQFLNDEPYHNHVWFRKAQGILMLGRVTKDQVFFSDFIKHDYFFDK